MEVDTSQICEFRVIRTIKGNDLPKVRLERYSPISELAVRAEFRTGEPYLLYLKCAGDSCSAVQGYRGVADLK